MPTKPLDRLMFAQGGLCFFCEKPLSKSEASVEHLVASANGGNNSDENCVVCCKALNMLLGSMSLKEKVQVVLNQYGQFRCPNSRGAATEQTPRPKALEPKADELSRVINDLYKRGTARPRTLKRLSTTIGALFQKKLPPHEITSLIERLKSKGLVTVTGTKVSYELPDRRS